jgi:pimeloyl-ACP methyl ester carboxylesterase
MACGFAAAAIDAPGHGDRPRTVQDERFVACIRERMAAGEPVGTLIGRDNAERAARAVPEWRATLDALEEIDEVGAGGPVAYWGLSLGSFIGVPLAAAEPKITAAVFGLAAHEALAEAAARVTVPIEFPLHWDDERCRARRASRGSTRSAPRRRRCTPTPAATLRYRPSRRRARSGSSRAISQAVTPPRYACAGMGPSAAPAMT